MDAVRSLDTIGAGMHTVADLVTSATIAVTGFVRTISPITTTFMTVGVRAAGGKETKRRRSCHEAGVGPVMFLLNMTGSQTSAGVVSHD